MSSDVALGRKYEAYSEYKNTCISWLPIMPQGWKTTKLKYLIKNLESGVSVNASDYPKSAGELGVLKTSCVYTREFRPEENKTVFEEETARVKCPVKAGSIIISRMNTPDLVGAAAYIDGDYQDLYLPDRLWQTVYENDDVQNSKYVHYFMYLKGFRDQISNYAEGASSSMQNIAKEDFLSIHLLLPEFSEQQKIANFLDHETAKIDTLIEKQQQLIKLLKEKRQAVISHAVTKGLNPDVPMRDSGVEWLGEVPEHWRVLKITSLYVENSSRADTLKEQSYPVLMVSIHHGISDKELTEEESDRKLQRSEDRSLYKVVHKNYLTYNMMRAWQGGYGASKVSGLVSPAYVVCEPKTTLDSYYFELVLRTSNAIAELKRFSKGITDFRLRLYWDEFKNIRVPVPPQEEIRLILKSISETNSIYDNLERTASEQIVLLQERRAALISAAVTGKIDVRNWSALNA